MDLTITASQVGLVNAAEVTKKQAGEALGHLQPVYLAGGKLYKAEAGDTAAKAAAVYVTLTSAQADEYVVVVGNGITPPRIRAGSIFTASVEYVVSATSGRIAPRSDLVTTDYITSLGVAESSSILQLHINATGIQVA